MKTLFIIDGVRTPFSKMGGALAGMDAVELGRAAIAGLLTKTGIDPNVIDETIFGCVGQPAHAQNIARVIALRAGIPVSKPAMTVHRNCASGLDAITTARERMAAGHGEVFVVGGTESMSNMPLYFSRSAAGKFAALSRVRGIGGKAGVMSSFRPADFMPVIGLKLGLTDPVSELNMGQTAELLAREYGISRDAQDAFSVRSHLRATQASWALEREIVPMYPGGFLDGEAGEAPAALRHANRERDCGQLLANHRRSRGIARRNRGGRRQIRMETEWPPRRLRVHRLRSRAHGPGPCAGDQCRAAPDKHQARRL
jgi:acetyl-CoA acetyltransferase